VKTFRTITMSLALVAALLALPMAQASAKVAADSAPVTEGDVTEARVNGMQVLVKRVPGAELVSTNLYIRGGARNWGKDNAGVESLALDVAASDGAGGLDKIAFAHRLAELGSSIDAGTGSDWSSISSKGLLRNFDPTFALLADVFLRPALTPAGVELSRSQALIGLQREEEQPDGRLAILVNDTLWAGQPYANRPQGTLATVKALTREQLAAHLAKPARGFAAVADRGRRRRSRACDRDGEAGLRRLAARRLHRHDLPEAALQPAGPGDREARAADQLPAGLVHRASPGDKDYAASRVAMSYMWDQLFKEVRTKRNLSYAPGAGRERAPGRFARHGLGERRGSDHDLPGDAR
jgi:zinc protease